MTVLNSYQSINLSQFCDSVKFRSRSGSGYHLVIDFYIVMFYMLMIFMKFSFVPQTFFRIFFFFGIRIRISLWNSLEKVILHMLKISNKFGVALQSFCENQNSLQNQDQDHDITLDFNTRPTFHTWKTPTKFCLDPLTPSKVIVSTWKVHVRIYIQTSRQTDRQKFFLACFVF